MTRAMLVIMMSGRPISVLYKNGDGFPAVIVHTLEKYLPHDFNIYSNEVKEVVGQPAEELVSILAEYLSPVAVDSEDKGCFCEWIYLDTEELRQDGFVVDLHKIQRESIPDYTYYFTVDQKGMLWVSICAYSYYKGENQIFFGLWKDAIVWKDRVDTQAIGWGYHEEIYDTNGNYLKQGE